MALIPVPSRTPPRSPDAATHHEFEDLQHRMSQIWRASSHVARYGNGGTIGSLAGRRRGDRRRLDGMADLPGAKHDDVNVRSRQRGSIVTGEIKERERKGILRRRKRRRTGALQYRVTLPGEADYADNPVAAPRGRVG